MYLYLSLSLAFSTRRTESVLYAASVIVPRKELASKYLLNKWITGKTYICIKPYCLQSVSIFFLSFRGRHGYYSSSWYIGTLKLKMFKSFVHSNRIECRNQVSWILSPKLLCCFQILPCLFLMVVSIKYTPTEF